MKKILTTFYIVRHGETDWNVRGIVQGHSDIPLNETGKKQAKKAGLLLKDIVFDLAFSSDLLRAKQTAQIVLLERKMAIHTTNALRERFFGTYEGKDTSLLIKDFNEFFNKIRHLPVDKRVKMKMHESMESDGDLISRCITLIREIAVAHPGKKILVTTHGGLMRILLIHFGFGTFETLPIKCIDNTAYFCLESDGVDFLITETFGIHKK